MKFILLILLFAYSADSQDITICNIPLRNNYYKNILPSKVIGHHDAKCQTFSDGKFSKELTKGFNALELCDTSQCEYGLADFRIYIKFKYNGNSKELYISKFGYVLEGQQMYKPNQKFMRLIAGRIGDNWWADPVSITTQ